jgi:glycosyltransferase involved in cell wall biosynthesis
LVSVCMITYNHEKYIAQAIEGIVSQQCNFKFELIIGDDCSKDKTRDIIISYAEKYPDVIVTILPEKNMGATTNSSACLARATGKYVAFVEGDDYWQDMHKLQRQFDFMEANPDFSLCFTRVDVVDDKGNEAPNIFPEVTKDEFTIEDVIMTEKCFIPTATLFFKNILPRPMPAFYMNAVSADIATHLILCDLGKVKCLPGKSAAYREHPGGITKAPNFYDTYITKLFDMFNSANEYFNFKYNNIIRARLLQMSKTRLIFGSKDLKGIKKLKYVMRYLPDYFKYSDRANIKELAYYITILFFPAALKLRKKVS